ncbi:hypothetical protein NQZ68_001263 [Dissostichus eleginoides]|nr:hypothetical protein NQZ68_001263 [Dissostichus eleginoides]
MKGQRLSGSGVAREADDVSLCVHRAAGTTQDKQARGHKNHKNPDFGMAEQQLRPLLEVVMCFSSFSSTMKNNLLKTRLRDNFSVTLQFHTMGSLIAHGGIYQRYTDEKTSPPLPVSLFPAHSLD